MATNCAPRRRHGDFRPLAIEALIHAGYLPAATMAGHRRGLQVLAIIESEIGELEYVSPTTRSDILH
jgi:hypothetical protein